MYSFLTGIPETIEDSSTRLARLAVLSALFSLLGDVMVLIAALVVLRQGISERGSEK